MPFSNVSRCNSIHAIAVIDIGATSIRMAVAQLNSKNSIQVLESLQQSISLGKDTFAKGIIQRETIEECVRALNSFKKVLKEYQITAMEHIRVVATTAVREAANKEVFLDRIKIATGFTVEVIDEIDVSRLIYLSIRSYMSVHHLKCESNVLVTEMSGGTTEVLHLQQGNVLLSKGYRLGALRLREMLEEYRAPLARHHDLMENEIRRTIGQICLDVNCKKDLTVIAIGGDARFAAIQIVPDWNGTDPVIISVESMRMFTSEIIEMSVDEIVHQYHLTFSDAETLGPSLLFYMYIADVYKLKSIVVSDISMRHGLLREMSMLDAWSNDYTQQIVNSALEIGRKFAFDETHAKMVANLSVVLFNALKDEHLLVPRYELLLRIAGVLHDIGNYISVRSHHKHSFYLIQNCELFGLNRKDIQIIAFVVRYHRRSAPKPLHDDYMALDRESRLIIVKLAAILRVADALDRSNTHRIKKIVCAKQKDQFCITIPDVDDLSLEQLALQGKGTLFDDVYGMKVVLRKQLSFLE